MHFFVINVWRSHRTSFCSAKYFRDFCVTIKQNVKQFLSRHLVPKIPGLQPVLALWTFPRGNPDFPLTKLPLSPNETFSFPKALSVSCFRVFIL